MAVLTGLLALLDRRFSMARSERLLVGRLQRSRDGAGAESEPAADDTFVDLALARARLASDGRQRYWSQVRTLERSNTDGWRRNPWFPLAAAFYGVLPIAFVSSLVEVRLRPRTTSVRNDSSRSVTSGSYPLEGCFEGGGRAFHDGGCETSPGALPSGLRLGPASRW